MLNINRPAHLMDQPCLGSDCALWVELQKMAMNPAYKHVYEGCGLVVNIPWERQEIKEEKKT